MAGMPIPIEKQGSTLLTIFCKRTYPKRKSRLFQPGGACSHASTFFRDLYPSFDIQGPTINSQFTAIKVFEKQLKYLSVSDLVKLKSDILSLMSNEESAKEPGSLLGLDLLHRAIF